MTFTEKSVALYTKCLGLTLTSIQGHNTFAKEFGSELGSKVFFISKTELYERMLNIRSNSMNESELKAKHYL